MPWSSTPTTKYLSYVKEFFNTTMQLLNHPTIFQSTEFRCWWNVWRMVGGGWTGRVLELYDLQKEIQLPTTDNVLFRSDIRAHWQVLIDSDSYHVLSRLWYFRKLLIVSKNQLCKSTFTDPKRTRSISNRVSSVQIRLQENTIKQDSSLVEDVTKGIRSHIGNLSPTYQVPFIYWLR